MDEHGSLFRLLKNLINMTPNIKFEVYGMNNIQPIWADAFFRSLSRCKMGINLSQGEPIKYYSSDRVTQLIGNGLLTFIDEQTLYKNFFSDKEMIFYKNLNDLSEKIFKFTRDEKSRKRIARSGKIKYLKYFNSTLVADYIIRKTLDINYSKNSFIWEK